MHLCKKICQARQQNNWSASAVHTAASKLLTLFGDVHLEGAPELWEICESGILCALGTPATSVPEDGGTSEGAASEVTTTTSETLVVIRQQNIIAPGKLPPRVALAS